MSQQQRNGREAVYTALQPFLKADTLHMAVDYWEQHFVNRAGGTLHRFITEIAHWQGLDHRRAEMLTALVAAMNTSTQRAAKGTVPHAAATPQADNTQVRAFESLMTGLLAEIDQLVAEQLRADLLVSLRGDRFPAAFLSRLRGWLLHRESLRPVSVDAGALRASVNQLYVLMAERIGPMEADRLLHQASEGARRSDPGLADAVARLL